MVGLKFTENHKYKYYTWERNKHLVSLSFKAILVGLTLGGVVCNPDKVSEEGGRGMDIWTVIE